MTSFLHLILNYLKRLSTVAKLFGVCALCLLLLVPLAFISSLLQDRKDRREQTIGEIISTWGPAQKIIGPILVLPFQYTVVSKEEVSVDNRSVVRNKETVLLDVAYFLPKQWNVDGKIDPVRRHKGIYEAVIYNADLHMTGEFPVPNLAGFKIPGQNLQILWDQAYVALPIADLRGVQEALKMKWADAEVPLLPGSNFASYPDGLHGAIPKPGIKPLLFDLRLQLRGSGSIAFAPIGVNNQVHLISSWPDPGFSGSFLPATSKIDSHGFDANWTVSYYGRNFPQQWLERNGVGLTPGILETTYYGVTFPMLVDAYRMTERAIKYGILFIALVFTTFFLFETLAQIKIHFVQYSMVGAALVLFYLVLLSLSEFIDFAVAYAVAALAAVALISFYCAKVLHSFTRSLGLSAGLLLVYGVLYIILQLQDYSLLVGTAGLFLTLTAMMFLTRNINWYQPVAKE